MCPPRGYVSKTEATVDSTWREREVQTAVSAPPPPDFDRELFIYLKNHFVLLLLLSDVAALINRFIL